MNIRTTTTVMPIERVPVAQLIDEAERAAYFQQSAQTRDGLIAEYQAPMEDRFGATTQ